MRLAPVEDKRRWLNIAATSGRTTDTRVALYPGIPGVALSLAKEAPPVQPALGRSALAALA
eukprot:5171125-Prorocentrum_lima.AAC.1